MQGEGRPTREYRTEQGVYDEKAQVIWSFWRHSTLSFVLNQGNIGDYGRENRAPSVLHTSPSAGGGLWLVLSRLAKQLCARWLPPRGTACREQRTRLWEAGTWIWGGWVSHPRVPCNDAASQSAATSAWPHERAGLGVS